MHFIFMDFQPGVTFMKTGADVVYGMLAGLLLAGIMMFGIALGAIRFLYMF